MEQAGTASAHSFIMRLDKELRHHDEAVRDRPETRLLNVPGLPFSKAPVLILDRTEKHIVDDRTYYLVIAHRAPPSDAPLWWSRAKSLKNMRISLAKADIMSYTSKQGGLITEDMIITIAARYIKDLKIDRLSE